MGLFSWLFGKHPPSIPAPQKPEVPEGSHPRLLNPMERMVPLFEAGVEPGGAHEYIARSAAREMNGDMDGAIADLDEALCLDPDNALAYSLRGRVRHLAGDLSGALLDHNAAVRLDPKDARNHYLRGVTRGFLGDVAGASDDYTRAILLDASLAEAYSDRGEIFLLLGETQRGMHDLETGLDRAAPGSPVHESVRTRLADLRAHGYSPLRKRDGPGPLA